MINLSTLVTAPRRRMTLFFIAPLLVACTGIETNTTPVDRFAKGNYKTYSWRAEQIENTGNSSDPLYTIAPTLRAAVDEELASKGYRYQHEGGDFLIHYQFKVGLSEGVPNAIANSANNRYDIPDAAVVVNRRTDQALVDNAYALSGPRETNNMLLQFSDRTTQSLVWATSMTKIVENVNEENTKKMRKSVNAAVRKVLRQLPSAN
jgi:hypothetical protein